MIFNQTFQYKYLVNFKIIREIIYNGLLKLVYAMSIINIYR